MRSIREQIEEFIEELFNGNVITIVQKEWEAYHQPSSLMLHTEDMKVAGQNLRDLKQLINDYVANPEQQTDGTALQLYRHIVYMRIFALIQNNPDSLKELNFYKQRYYDETKNNNDLRSKLKNAYDANDQLQQVINNDAKGKESPTRG